MQCGASLEGPYLRPPTALFASFCDRLIDAHDLSGAVDGREVRSLDVSEDDERAMVTLDDSEVLTAGAVVVATNQGRPRIPGWASDAVEAAWSPGPAPVIRHSVGVDLRSERLQGRSVLVVGGGLTAAHLAVGAAERGAAVRLVCRRGLRTQTFDADPGWLGPRFLAGFEAEPRWDRRREMIREARNGGSIPEDMDRRLRGCRGVTLTEGAHVREAEVVGEQWTVTLDDGEAMGADEIWLATGVDHDVRTIDLLARLMDRRPLPIAGGLPVIRPDLRWPGAPVWLMGSLSGLQLGPAAVNLSGARMASTRIVPSLRSHLGGIHAGAPCGDDGGR